MEGRQHFKHRCAVVVQDADDAIYVLQEVDSREKHRNRFQGIVVREFEGQEAIQQYAQGLITQSVSQRRERRGYQKTLFALAEFYCQGYALDWQALFDGVEKRTVHLPSYPFTKERYWISVESGKLRTECEKIVGQLHPLVHQNTSTLSEQRFSSTFTGSEFFLADHLVDGQRVLPGVVYLEMARVAIEQAVGEWEGARSPLVRLENVTWVQPLMVGDKPARIHIGLHKRNNNAAGAETIDFKIYSQAQGLNVGATVYCQGSAIVGGSWKRTTAPQISALDPAALQKQCDQGVLTSRQCYNAFSIMGLDYGPAYRGIDTVYTGCSQVLAKLRLPAGIEDTLEHFFLHPGLLDSALQASIGLPGKDVTGAVEAPADTSGMKLFLPFALRALELYQPCSASMWTLIKTTTEGGGVDKKTFGQTTKSRGIDIDLYDESGDLCVRLRGFFARAAAIKPPLVQYPEKRSATAHGTEEIITLAPVWDPIPLVKRGGIFPTDTARLVVVGANEAELIAIRRYCPNACAVDIFSASGFDLFVQTIERMPISHIVWIVAHSPVQSSCDEALIEQQNLDVLTVFRAIKALLHLGYGSKALGWTMITVQGQAVYRNEHVNPAPASIHGLMGALAKEYGNWNVRLVDLEETSCIAPHIDGIFKLPADPQGNAWGYRGERWFRQRLIPVRCSAIGEQPYRPNGVYVVIGGAGGIGAVWSEAVIRACQAQIIWIGRRRKNADIQAKINALATLGPPPHYIMADATDQKALRRAYEEIKRHYGAVQGVVHSAIALLDQSLASMEENRFRQSLVVKVDASVRLAQVFAAEELDFILFFSAMQSFIKAPGQSNYAAGCTFIDAFAHRLAREWSGSDRSPMVKVMNWGYWGSVGVVASREYKDRMAALGIGSLEPAEAMLALDTLLTGPLPQLAVIKTISQTEPEPGAAHPAVNSPLSSAVSFDEAIQFLPPTRPSIIRRIQERNPYRHRSAAEMAIRSSLDWEEMDELLGQILWAQLQSMGILSVKNNLPEIYVRWFDETIKVLIQLNYLKPDSQGLEVAAMSPVDMDTLWEKWNRQKRLWLKNCNIDAQLTLVETTLRALPSILTGERLVTDVLFPDSSMAMVENVYRNNPVSDVYNEVVADMLVASIREELESGSLESDLHDGRNRSHRRTSVRILEVGAGTGGGSAVIFEKLNSLKVHIEEYCYTDISKAFLWHAEKEYGPEVPYLNYKIFDVEKPVTEQGVPIGGYDFIVANNVLHTTKNIRNTLRNIKSAMKKNGLLIINEISNRSLFTHLTFGLLEGWWLYDDPELRISGCPALLPETWQQVLENEGFGPTFFPARNFHELGQQVIVIESDGIIRLGQKFEQQTNRYHQNLLKQSSVKSALSQQTGKSRSGVPGRSGVTDKMIEDYIKTSLCELIAESLRLEDGVIQEGLSFSEFGVDSIIGVNLINQINQKFNLRLPTIVLFDYNSVDSLSRYLLEEHRSSIMMLVQEDEPASPEALAENRVEVSISNRVNVKGPSQLTVNCSLPPGHPYYSRRLASSPEVSNGKNTYPYHRVLIKGSGEVADITAVEAESMALKENEIRIAVRAFSLNFGDLLCIKGLYPSMPPYPFTPGVEASGVVTELGGAVTSVREGDEVVAFTGENLGGQATMIVCEQEQVFPRPATLSFEEACALPSVAITMIEVFKRAQLKRGEKILIQTATSNTGLIAVQMAKYLGAEIFATAGSQRKLDYLEKLGVPHLINYEEKDFEREIRKLTNGAGVDVVINTLSENAIQKGMNCLLRGGRYIEIAMTALKSAKSIDLSILDNNQSFSSVDLRKLSREEPKRLAEHWRDMIDLINRKIIRPTISHILPFQQIQQAYRHLQDRNNVGKIVITVADDYRFEMSGPAEIASGRKTERKMSAPLLREPVAIVGMSIRFAKSDTAEALWEHLSTGTDLLEPVSRWNLAEYYGDTEESVDSIRRDYCNYGSFLEDIDKFDPLFFDISGTEAMYMDPQQRLFLEEAWKALENAGYAGDSVAGKKCGVYVGCTAGDYQLLFDDVPPPQSFWGNAVSVLASRIAYYMDLQGPAIAIDTACSSSLVAIHQACQGLWTGEIDMALAGGVSVQTTPGLYLSSNHAGMLSPTGRCYTFDGRADGFVPGEGVGVVVLKRLTEAVCDGDHMLGVIRGSGINQDGKTNGITAPSAKSQERLERYVYDTFDIHPTSIQMIEAHGTGTLLGDPIEYHALTLAFRQYTDKERFCAIGSIKSNLGHAIAAAGIAGVAKALLSLQYKKIPPSLNYQTANPNIQFEGSPFYVNTSLVDWQLSPTEKCSSQQSVLLRRAAVSSFGFSGTNAHLVIEEAPPITRRHQDTPGYLIVLSARTCEQLRRQVIKFVEYCDKERDKGSFLDCGNVSYTLLVGRKHFNHRLACVVRNEKELLRLFGQWLEKR